ncbi:phage tail family protein [Streptomyces reniochalinae]|nr:phage tail domain-containing protein [Streptomyces reniochalinae]
MGAENSAVQVSEVDGLLSLPDIRTADLELVQRHGLWPGDDYMGGRSLTVTLQVTADTAPVFSRAVTDIQAAFMPGRDEKPFRFLFPGIAADTEAYVNVRPRKRSGVLSSRFVAGAAELVVELFATDPYIYGAGERTVTVTSSQRDEIDGGLTVPFTVPLTVKGSSSPPPDPVSRFFERGSVAARPLVVFENTSNPVLTDDVTRKFFGITYSGRFTVDSANEVVTDAEGNDITSLVTAGSSWPEFGPGDHRLRLNHGDPLTAASAVLTWQDRWV